MSRLLSIVVANHGRDISRLKEFVQDRNKGDVELIVVDAGFERSKQRNVGIQNSSGDYILWLDSDQSISNALVDETFQIFEKTDATCIVYPEYIIATGFFAKVRQFDAEFCVDTLVWVPRAVRREHCPRFNEDEHGTEDSSWDRQIKGLRGYARNYIYHFDAIDLLTYLKKKAYYSKSIGVFAKNNPNDKLLTFKYRVIDVYWGAEWKRKKIFKNPFMFLCVMAVVFLRGVVLLWTTKKLF
jgi:glycosyltransferase involved in cell wall biosynthesis